MVGKISHDREKSPMVGKNLHGRKNKKDFYAAYKTKSPGFVPKDIFSI